MLPKYQDIQYVPGLLIVKDVNSSYLNMSDEAAKLVGWHSPNDSIGKTDFDLPCRANEYAEIYRVMDAEAVNSSEKMLTLDINQYTTGPEMLLTERNPIKNGNDTVGLFTQMIKVTRLSQFVCFFNLHKLDTKFLENKFTPISYKLNETYCPLPLTEQQANCLFLLMRGKTAKEIARVLKLSYRTVEAHVEKMKLKLYCSSKSDLIEKAFESGFLYYVPKYFQNALTAYAIH